MAHQTKGPALLIVTTCLLALANSFAGLRLYVRLARKKFGIDDAFLLLAVVILDVQSAFIYCCIYYGFGHHGAELTRTSLHTALMYFYLIQVMYKLLGGATKAAFVCLYLRIFPNPRFQFFAKWIVGSCILLTTIAFTIATIFMCTPIRYSWNKGVVGGHCINKKAFWYSHAAVHTSLDLVIFSMPIPLVWQLQMSAQKRFSLIAVFLLGFFGCIASIIRMTSLNSSSKSQDPTWGSYTALLWTEVEATISIICASLPPLRGAMRDVLNLTRDSTNAISRDRSHNLQSILSSRKTGRSRLEGCDIDDRTHEGGIDTPSHGLGGGESKERILRGDGITKVTAWNVEWGAK